MIFLLLPKLIKPVGYQLGELIRLVLYNSYKVNRSYFLY